MRQIRKKRLACLLIFALLAQLLPVGTCQEIKAWEGDSFNLNNPRMETSEGDVVTTWDCVWFGGYWKNDTNGDGKIDENDEKEPIKWRVLSVDGDEAFLLSDTILDCEKYNQSKSKEHGIIWENCTLRSWLNGYGASANDDGIDYTADNFYNTAFTADEQSAIRTKSVANDICAGCIESNFGNNTEDPIFLLSYDEAINPEYGFSSVDTDDKTRESKGTAYAATKGMWWDELMTGEWFLRTANLNYNASYVSRFGFIMPNGYWLSNFGLGIRPVLYLDLSSDAWEYAGTVSSDETSQEPTPPPEETPITETPTETPTASPSVSPDVSQTPTPSATSTPSVSKQEQEAVDKFVEDHITDPNGNIITEVTDLTRDIIVSGEDDWKKLSTASQEIIDDILRKAGSQYVYEQLLKLAKAYKIPGFKVIKFMQKNSKARLKLIKCDGANIVCLSSNPKIATINKRGIIRAKKPGRATLTFVAIKGKYTNRLIIDVRVKKKFENAKELSRFNSKAIRTPTVLIAKKRLLTQSSRIRVYDLLKDSKVTFTPLKKQILTVNKKGKYTGKKRGSTLVRVKIHQNDKDYLLYVYVTIH